MHTGETDSSGLIMKVVPATSALFPVGNEGFSSLTYQNHALCERTVLF